MRSRLRWEASFDLIDDDPAADRPPVEAWTTTAEFLRLLLFLAGREVR